MQIDEAISELRKGVTLYSSSLQKVQAFDHEGRRCIRVFTMHEDGEDVMEMPEHVFGVLYVKQRFSHDAMEATGYADDG